MNTDLSLQNSLLYEIAISIGNSMALSKMLKESLTVMMRKLDGISIAVVDKHSSSVDQEISTLAAYPRRGFKKAFLKSPDNLDNRPVEHGVHHLLKLEVCEDSYCYYFELPATGYLMFVRRQPMSKAILKMLDPVCVKLDNSIQACLASEALHQKEQDLSDSLVQLKLAQKTKDRFLANMSHEIRTPLNGILGFIQQLAETPLNEEQQRFVEIIDKSSHTLLGVINDILDFSKMESGQLEIDPHPFSLIEELSPAIQLFKCRASEKNVLLDLQYDPQLKRTIIGDSLRLKQVISNLVSNAIKFTDKGEVCVSLKLVSDSSDKVRIEFSVADTGIGMDQAQLAKIFNPFSQADKSISRFYGGTGLGLAISKQLVHLMGGELQVKSTLGEGSIFSFCLDFTCAEPVTSKPATVSQPVFQTKNRRVLLVEDNQVNQLLMRSILGKLEVEFDLAENGEQAIEAYQNQRYDLIFMDINMPIMDGITAFETIKSIYQQEQGYYVPVVALTANALVGDCEHYQSLGMQGCLTKPLQLPKLTEILAKYLTDSD